MVQNIADRWKLRRRAADIVLVWRCVLAWARLLRWLRLSAARKYLGESHFRVSEFLAVVGSVSEGSIVGRTIHNY